MKKMMTLGLFVLFIVGSVISSLITFNEMFFPSYFNWKAWIPFVIDVIGLPIMAWAIWKFFRLIKAVFDEIPWKKLPEIIWNFFQILPEFFRRTLPILKTLWKNNKEVK